MILKDDLLRRYGYDRYYRTKHYLFWYTGIMVAILVAANYILGFTIDGLGIKQNLLANFLAYLAFCALVLLTPVLHRVFVSPFFQDNIFFNLPDEELMEMAGFDEDEIDEFGNLRTEMKVMKVQTVSLAIIFILLIFELFFIHAWVKGQGLDRHLIWTPEWAQSVINCFKGNTDVDPYHPNDPGMFLFESHYAKISSEELFQMPVTDAAYFFHFFRLLFLPVIDTCLVAIFVVRLQVVNLLEAYTLNVKVQAGLGRRIWLGVMALVALFCGLMFIYIYTMAVDQMTFPGIVVKNGLELPLVNVIYIMLGIGHLGLGLWLIWGWLAFWKEKVLNVIHFFRS